MNVGLRSVVARDDVQGVDVPVHLLYPTHAPTELVKQRYPIEAARDGAPEGRNLRPIVVSHGGRGTPWVMRGLLTFLASQGFVVVALEHPGDRLFDDALYGKEKTLHNRPRHVKLGIDAAFEDTLVGPRLSTRGVGVFGQSMGGFTALAAAGGRPGVDAAHADDGVQKMLDVTHDPRIRALVLHAPTAFWFVPEGALAAVDVPILLFEPEKEEILPPGHAAIIVNGVRDPKKVDHRIEKGAGHFASLTPFPESMKRPDFPPANDPPGFDRVAYQKTLFPEIAAFFDTHLS